MRIALRSIARCAGATATAVSWFICVLFVALGVRSLYAGDIINWTRVTAGEGRLWKRAWGIGTGQGIAMFDVVRGNISPRTLSEPYAVAFRDSYREGSRVQWKRQRPDGLPAVRDPRTFWERRGVFWESWDLSTASHRRLVLPLWLPAALFAVAPFGWVLGRVIPMIRAQRRLRRGRCWSCGYDLRATPQRCPECGHSTELASDRFGFGVRTAGALVAISVIGGGVFAGSDWPERPQIAPAGQTAQSTAPATRPFERNELRDDIVYEGLPMFNAVHGVPEGIRKIAASLDVSRTYAFVYATPDARPSLIKHKVACVQLFVRRASRWRRTIMYLREGQVVGNGDFPTTLKIGEIREAADDFLVSFVDNSGSVHVRSGNADLASPIQKFLMDLTGYSGIAWDKELFGA